VLTFGSLFAGIGGFDLGFERAGLVCRWQVEIDPFCRGVLEKHWPHVRRHDDVRTFPPRPIKEWKTDVICGGFPCQDISNVGKRAGISGSRSRLWYEFARCLRVLRPRFAVVENVAALSHRGLDRVLGDLAEIGYDAEWSTLSACALGAPHTRARLFVVAHAADQSRQRLWSTIASACEKERDLCRWPNQPEPLRVADGVPRRMDRIRALGNAVVPQVAELIERALIAVDAADRKTLTRNQKHRRRTRERSRVS